MPKPSNGAGGKWAIGAACFVPKPTAMDVKLVFSALRKTQGITLGISNVQ